MTVNQNHPKTDSFTASASPCTCCRDQPAIVHNGHDMLLATAASCQLRGAKLSNHHQSKYRGFCKSRILWILHLNTGTPKFFTSFAPDKLPKPQYMKGSSSKHTIIFRGHMREGKMFLLTDWKAYV